MRWLGLGLASLLLACESTLQVGSACPEGACAAAAPMNMPGLACVVGTVEFDFDMISSINQEGSTGDRTYLGFCTKLEMPRNSDGAPACRLLFAHPGADRTRQACADRGGRLTEPAPDIVACEIRPGEDPNVSGWIAQDVGQQCVIPGTALSLTGDLTFESDTIFSLYCDTAYAAPVGSISEQAQAGAMSIAVSPSVCPNLRDPGAVAEAEVGRACAPTTAPLNGTFVRNEVHIDTASAECSAGLCLVYRLQGSAAADCTEACPSPAELEQRVHCTCRCAAEGLADVPLCNCPEGFSCERLIESGPATGSYCVDDRNLGSP